MRFIDLALILKASAMILNRILSISLQFSYTVLSRLYFLLLGFVLPFSVFSAQDEIGDLIVVNAEGGAINDFTGDGAVSTDFIIEVGDIPMDYYLNSVCLSISHKRTSDIKIELVNPQGSSIWLSNRNGGAKGKHYVNTCFSNDGFSGYIINASAPFTGEYIPDGRMSFLNDGDANGNWTLRVYDLEKDISGDLYFVQLKFSDQETVSPLSNCSLDSLVNCDCSMGGKNCELLPDLVLLESLTENSIKYYSPDHDRYPGQIRFATSIANVGDGPIEIIGTNNKVERDKIIYEPVDQVVYYNVNRAPRIVKNVAYKYYDDKPGHDHYHVDNWVEFKLLEVKKILFWTFYKEVQTSQKVSFCLFDTGICTRSGGLCDHEGQLYSKENLPNYGIGQYESCFEDKQGISVGGYDTYGVDYEGQFIDAPKDILTGNYILQITIDPLNQYLELNKGNNISTFSLTHLKDN